MPNKNYIKGRRKEYKIQKALRDEGFQIAQRTAGSHSPIDIIAINTHTHMIKLVQCKPENINKEAIIEQNKALNGLFKVFFEVL